VHYQPLSKDQLDRVVIDRDPDHLQAIPGRPDLAGQPMVLSAGGPPRMVGVNIVLVFPEPLTAWGHFSTTRAFFGVEVWRFITFQFLHSGFMHILFNMFGLWVFGGMVEQALGSKRYAAFYLVCGVFGAVSYLVLNLLGQTQLRLPGVLIDEAYTPLVGASAGVFGVIIACAYIAPNAIVQLLFPPIPLRLKWFAYGYVALAAWNLLRGGDNAGGDAAHLGGAAAGFFFIRNSHLLRDFFDIIGDSRRPGGGRGGGAQPQREEIDRILQKVSTQGLQSLSDAEKAALRRASESARGG
jgi:membrane associated rhomboid family serine protease